MDLIRIFATIAFSDISKRYRDDKSKDNYKQDLSLRPGKLMFDQEMFVDECRLRHPELSDDQMRMIYGLYKDEWSFRHDIHHGDSATTNDRSIFNVVFLLTDELLRISSEGKPLVRFRHLFRWRELTQILGEDTFTSALWAYTIRHRLTSADYEPPVGEYPTVLHNDNAHLLYLFKTIGLAELHSHLYAAADNFGIAWTCLMNHISGQQENFLKLAAIHDPSRQTETANRVMDVTAEANAIRIYLWKYIESKNEDYITHLLPFALETNREDLDRLSSEARIKDSDLDYIKPRSSTPLNVFAGERLFLFRMFDLIIRGCDIRAQELFYRYILLKNDLRSFMVQVNENMGFGNFKRYQDVKSYFLRPHYKRLLSSIPIWEASTFNFTKIYEARVVPHEKPSDLGKLVKRISESLDQTSRDAVQLGIIYHFIKRPDQNSLLGKERDADLRTAIEKQSAKLDKIKKHSNFESRALAIDAASSELYCRPEVFAQAFRFLKVQGFDATFHAGEDFYDLADGLRAIFEAVNFLGLEAGDRIGHAIALGLDPYQFYKIRHNFIALPKQWMLDNVVWLYFYARKHNVMMEPSTEEFLLITYRRLMEHIGYEESMSGQIDIRDYYESMLLRGDNPACYDADGFNKAYAHEIPEDMEIWSNYHLATKDKDIMNIREFNSVACSLYNSYHFDRKILRNGKYIKSFQLPEGYADFIFRVQEKMIREMSKRRIGIECCPSSNFKIGGLYKFECHPIFRFMPVVESESRYPLSVTVNTDDLGIFATSLPNEYSILTLALLKKRDAEGNHLYSSQQVYDWIERVIKNGLKFHFERGFSIP